MAILDNESNNIVVRIVYAGPPLAGKTESLQALAGMLLGSRAEQAVFSPDEAHGRTLYFDWLDYVGGFFKGRRVRCQIVAVPGQDALVERRRLILESADAVVFVVDSHPEQMAAATRHYREMTPWLERSENEPPVGVMIQANKRDLPNAVPLDKIKQALGDDPNLGVVASTATQGKGVREAFVMCVGLSLERASALVNSGHLATGKPDVVNGEQLLQQIEANEASSHADPEELHEDSTLDDINDVYKAKETPELIQALSASMADLAGRKQSSPAKIAEPTSAKPAHSDKPENGTAPPKLPHARLMAGTIWPPVAGRIALHEISKEEEATPEHRHNGTWTARIAERWQLMSQGEQVFPSLEQGRVGLLDYARRHKTMEAVLSAHRCVALAPSNGEQWRLWEIVRLEKTLADTLVKALSEANPTILATRIFEIANFLVHAQESFSTHGAPLSVSLETVGRINGKPVYTGIMPMSTETVPASINIPNLLRGQFADPIAHALERNTTQVPAVLRWLKLIRTTRPTNDAVIETLSALFIGH